MAKVLKGALPGFVMEIIGVALLFTPLAPLGMSMIVAGSNLLIAGAVMGALSYFVKKPQSARMDNAIDRLHISINPQALGKWVFGETAFPGDIVYAEQGGTNKDRITYIIAGAAHRIESFGNFYINDELITFTGDSGQGAWYDTVFRRTKTGAPGQTHIGNNFGNMTNSLPATFIGENTAYYGLVLHAGQTKTKDSLPTRYTQVVKGAPVYDPRLDTTVGGSGSHRANDQTTWQYSAGGVDIGANAALVILFYLIGWRTAGGALIFGMGVDPADIDYDAFMAAATVCDETLDGKRRYRIGGVLDISQEHEQIISQLEAAVGAKVGKFGGKYTVWVPNDDLTPYSSIGEVALLREASVEFMPAGPIETLFNTSRGRYIEPAQLYQAIDYPEVIESAAVTEDGRSRVMAHDFALVQDVSIAERVVRQLIRRSRFTATWKFALGPKGLLFKPFSVTTLNIQETNFEDVTVRITNMQYGMNGMVAIECVEEDSSIYDTTAALGTPVTQLDPAAFDPATTIAVSGLTSADISLSGDAGTATDALKISWTDPGSLVGRTEVQYKIATEADWQAVPPARVDLAHAIISPVERLTLYDLRARHVTILGVPGAWSSIQDTAGDTIALDPGAIGFTGELDADNTGRHAAGLLNPNFEGGDTGWNKGAGWSIVSDGNALPGGAWCARYEGDAFIGLFNDSFISVKPGDRVILTTQGKKTSGTITARMEMYSFDAAGNLINGTGGIPYQYADTVLTATYQPVRLVAIVPAGAVKVRYQINAAPTGAAVAYFDACDYAIEIIEPSAQGLINADLEAGDIGWSRSSSDCEIVNDPANAADGLWVMRMKSTGVDDEGMWNDRYIRVAPGERVFASCLAKKSGTGDACLWVDWRDINKGYLSSAPASNNSSSYVPITVIGVAPASAAFAQVAPKLLNTDATGIAYFDKFEYAKYPKNSDIDVAQTTNVGALATKNSVDLATGEVTNKNTGNISETSSRHYVGSVHAGGLIAGFNANPITGWTDAGSTATINIQATTLTTGERSANYPSGSVSGLNFGTKYYIYRDDPSLDGSGSYAATTSLPTAVGNNGRVYFGVYTTGSDGGGGGGGGGGNPGCVADDQWIGDEMAGAALAGLPILCLDHARDGTIEHPIESVEFSLQPCVEIVTASGIRLVASVSTPMTLRDGWLCNITEMQGREVAVLDEGAFRWEPVTSVLSAGVRRVAHIHVGGRTYAAGSVHGRYIFSHNPEKP